MRRRSEADGLNDFFPVEWWAGAGSLPPLAPCLFMHAESRVSSVRRAYRPVDEHGQSNQREALT